MNDDTDSLVPVLTWSLEREQLKAAVLKRDRLIAAMRAENAALRAMLRGNFDLDADSELSAFHKPQAG